MDKDLYTNHAQNDNSQRNYYQTINKHITMWVPFATNKRYQRRNRIFSKSLKLFFVCR